MSSKPPYQLPLDEILEVDPRNLSGKVSFDWKLPKGHGGFGDVYQGTYRESQSSRDERACVKVLKVVPIFEQKQFIKSLRRMKREIKIWCNLSHPNIVEFHGWMLETNDGIIHETAKLCDFGLSSILDDITTYAQSTSTQGTIRFVSPELLGGTSEGRNKMSDVWAFGWSTYVLEQILHDKPPYAWVRSEFGIPMVALSALPYRLDDPDAVSAFLSTCFARSPGERPVMSDITAKLCSLLYTSIALQDLRALDSLPLIWRYLPNDDIPDLRAEFEKLVPSSLQSICCDWYGTVCQSRRGDKRVLIALREAVPELLYWIAAMGIMGKIDQVLTGLYDLGKWAVGTWASSSGIDSYLSVKGDSQLQAILQSLYRMVSQSRAAFSRCSLSILAGSHPFLPTSSALQSTFPQLFSRHCRAMVTGMSFKSDAWSPLVSVLRHNSPVYSVALSFDGHYLASASDDKTVQIWDVASGTTAAVLNGHSDSVHSVAFSADGRCLASASNDKTVQIWDVASRVTSATLHGHTNWMCCIVFSPNGRRLASGSDVLVRIWDIASGAVTLLSGHTEGVKSVTFSLDGCRLASASEDKTVRIWDVASETISTVLSGHVDWVNSVSFSLDGGHLATSSSDNTVRIWNVASGTTSAVLTGHTDPVHSVTFSPDGHRLASSSSDKTVRVWDVASRKVCAVLSGHTDWVRSVAFASDCRRLASASDDKTVRIWDVASVEDINVVSGHSDTVHSVAISPEGRRLASASGDGTVRIWDVASGTVSAVLTGHADWVHLVAFSPDGCHLASGSFDKTTRIWDIASGTTSNVLDGHAGLVRSVSFSPDGRHLASVSSDEKVRLWNIGTGTCLGGQWFPNPTSVSFSNDGACLAVHSDVGTQYVHSLALTTMTASEAHQHCPSNTAALGGRYTLQHRSLCVKHQDATLHICWLPDFFEASTTVNYDKDKVWIGGQGGEIIFVDLSEFKLPTV
ncbi:quinon protein alcohol dehydrogenase-like superfamily [Cantharellus anzutake]|uniref:quinon protein alcohol dehydrogenase-like superfamily n=1 Tax=Cantharellus anzutake TaxID=1750568 RepID=UPI00190564B7|nr:quinon protein alcohol dehydrogenase-like superfamily [Cantharellus anzutake]KAF8325406.1 quinon protein alcohol dehydrogenase-like superfamily [Cantharellus anzutake]